MAYVNYSTKFRQDEIHALRKYALGIPSGPVNYQHALPNHPGPAWGGAGALVAGPYHQRRISGLLQYDWGANHANAGVERVRLYKLTNNHVSGVGGQRVFSGPPMTQAEGAIQLEFTTAAHGFDAYFLPWTGRGGALYMTLPAGGAPRHFFTAALSGCSVMVVGPPNSPTIYHCGIDTWGPASPYVDATYAQPNDPPAPDPRTTHELWVDLVAHIANDANAAFRNSTIDKRQYINDFDPADPQTTPGSRALSAALQQNRNDPAATAIPFGSVFGLKDNAGNWSFYLQANVTMIYGAHPNQRKRCRPVEIIQFYPYWQTYARTWNFNVIN